MNVENKSQWNWWANAMFIVRRTHVPRQVTKKRNLLHTLWNVYILKTVVNFLPLMELVEVVQVVNIRW